MNASPYPAVLGSILAEVIGLCQNKFQLILATGYGIVIMAYKDNKTLV